MVVKRRLLFAITTAASLVIAAAAPISAGYKNVAPDPLRNENLLRVQDIQAVAASDKYSHGPSVAIGWREGSKSSAYYLTYSVDGGKSYRKGNGNMRKARIAGDRKSGMSLDICAGRIWAGTAINLGDGAWPTDVVLSTRDVVGTGADQARVTVDGARKVRDVSVACLGDKFIAIGWLEQSNGKDRVRLMLRSLESPSQTPAYKHTYGLGTARFMGGVDVAATPDAVHVAWVAGTREDIAYKRLTVGPQKVPVVRKKGTRTVARRDAGAPMLSSRGSRVVLGYTDAGRVKVKVSKDRGASFEPADTVISRGTPSRSSKLHSVDVAAGRIVVGASANKSCKLVSTLVTSSNLGKTWTPRAYGNNGSRMGALLKRSGGAPLARLAWHHNNTSGKDVLRSRYETTS